MSILTRIRQYLHKFIFSATTGTLPDEAYNLWADKYDHQPDNLMLSLDSSIFEELLNDVNIKDKILIDIGCGTGRHWNDLIKLEPMSISGYDVSIEMLSILKQKFPSYQAIHLTTLEINRPNNSCDVIISTLTIAHIQNMKAALLEWHRVLRPGGEMIITDYHPDALKKGGNRTFQYHGKIIAVKNYIHSITSIIKYAKQLDMDIIRLTERKIDQSVKSWYEKQNALDTFERFNGTTIIYGIHIKKRNETT